MRTGSLALIAFASITLSDGSSEACILVRVEGAKITPEPDQRAPLDTHVFAVLDAEWAHAEMCPKDWDGAKACPRGDFALIARTAATPESAPVQVTLETKRSIQQGEDVFVELVPKGLAAKTRYEIVLAEKGAHVPPRVVGTFTTTATRDTEPPQWKGILGSSVTAPTAGILILCSMPMPFAEIRIDRPIDTSPVRYEVFVSKPGGAIDTTKTPNAVLDLDYAAGHYQVVVPAAVLPPGKDVRVAIRPIDIAGNVGTSSEVTIDTSPKTTKKP
ncbi:MAG: hypothetical protein ACXVEE_31635 [Polyangiales bacterium]